MYTDAHDPQRAVPRPLSQSSSPPTVAPEPVTFEILNQRNVELVQRLLSVHASLLSLTTAVCGTRAQPNPTEGPTVRGVEKDAGIIALLDAANDNAHTLLSACVTQIALLESRLGR